MNAWFLAQLSPHAPGFWLLLSSFGLLLWPWVNKLPSKRARRYTLVALWLFPPYLGLISGGLSPRLIGLSDLDWLTSLSLGLGMIFTVMATLLLVRATAAFGATATDSAVSQRNATQPPQVHLPIYVNEWMLSGAEEFHWCFLRGGLWEMLLTLPTPPASPAYIAVWLASLLAGAELLILSRNNSQRLLKLVVLLTTTILFFYTRNFWLSWFLHGAAWLILQPVRAHSATAAQASR